MSATPPCQVKLELAVRIAKLKTTALSRLAVAQRQQAGKGQRSAYEDEEDIADDVAALARVKQQLMATPEAVTTRWIALLRDHVAMSSLEPAVLVGRDVMSVVAGCVYVML